MPSGTKLYAIINRTSGIYWWNHFTYGYPEGGSEPVPTVPEEMQAVYVSPETLGALSEEEFLATQRPVMVSNQFDHWALKAASPIIIISEDPYDDGSNTPTISIGNGPANKGIFAEFSRPVSANVDLSTLMLDGNGEISFKIKVIGQGRLTLTIRPRGNNLFLDPDPSDITVVPAPFS